MAAFEVKLRLRGTEGQRKTALVKKIVYAETHEGAITRAKKELIDLTSYEVRRK